jgi:hypothetical protein
METKTKRSTQRTVGIKERFTTGSVDPVVNRKKNQKLGLTMRGVFWNIRGSNQPSRNLSLWQIIRDN